MINDSIKYKIAKDCTRDEILRDVTDWVATAYYLGGKGSIDSKELSIVTNTVIDELLDKSKPVSNLRMCEVLKALKEGAKGSFDSYYTISGKVCIGFLRSYQGSDIQKAYRKELQDVFPKPKQIAQRTQMEKDKISSDGIRHICEQIRNREPQFEIFCDLKEKAGIDVNKSQLREVYMREALRLGMNEEYEIIRSYGRLQ